MTTPSKPAAKSHKKKAKPDTVILHLHRMLRRYNLKSTREAKRLLAYIVQTSIMRANEACVLLANHSNRRTLTPEVALTLVGIRCSEAMQAAVQERFDQAARMLSAPDAE